MFLPSKIWKWSIEHQNCRFLWAQFIWFINYGIFGSVGWLRGGPEGFLDFKTCHGNIWENGVLIILTQWYIFESKGLWWWITPFSAKPKEEQVGNAVLICYLIQKRKCRSTLLGSVTSQPLGCDNTIHSSSYRAAATFFKRNHCRNLRPGRATHWRCSFRKVSLDRFEKQSKALADSINIFCWVSLASVLPLTSHPSYTYQSLLSLIYIHGWNSKHSKLPFIATFAYSAYSFFK